MNWLRNFMTGRYGTDQLNVYLLVFSILLTLFGRIAGNGTLGSVLILLSYIPLIAVVYRMFSKDVQKRSMENYRFAIFISPLYARFKKLQSAVQRRFGRSKTRGNLNTQKKWEDAKKYKYYTCPACKHRMKVPRGKGKIRITCKTCGHKFEKRT